MQVVSDELKRAVMEMDKETRTNVISITLVSEDEGLLDEYQAYLKEHEDNVHSPLDVALLESASIQYADNLSADAITVLKQCYENPKIEGDVESKDGLLELINKRLLTEIAMDSTFGYNAVTRLGYRTLDRLLKRESVS